MLRQPKKKLVSGVIPKGSSRMRKCLR
jgi:hypothetical protein